MAGHGAQAEGNVVMSPGWYIIGFHDVSWEASPYLSGIGLTVAPDKFAECVALDAGDHAAVVAFCRELAIGFVIIGPEAPLVAGLADDLAAAGIKHFGPSRAAAQLEGSKGFTKDLCAEFDIPTAAYARLTMPRRRVPTWRCSRCRWSSRPMVWRPAKV